MSDLLDMLKTLVGMTIFGLAVEAALLVVVVPMIGILKLLGKLAGDKP